MVPNKSLIVAPFFLLCAVAGTPIDEFPFFEGRIKDLQVMAKYENKPIFIYFYSNECETCDQMESQLWSERDLIYFTRKYFFASKKNLFTYEGRLLARKFNVKSPGEILVLSPQGCLLERWDEYTTAERFIQKLQRCTISYTQNKKTYNKMCQGFALDDEEPTDVSTRSIAVEDSMNDLEHGQGSQTPTNNNHRIFKKHDSSINFTIYNTNINQNKRTCRFIPFLTRNTSKNTSIFTEGFAVVVGEYSSFAQMQRKWLNFAASWERDIWAYEETVNGNKSFKIALGRFGDRIEALHFSALYTSTKAEIISLDQLDL